MNLKQNENNIQYTIVESDDNSA